MTKCYLNGNYIELEDAKISALDRGFIFGEGIYEVIGVFLGKPFAVPLHLDRLNQNVLEMGMPNPLSDVAWTELIANLIARNNCIGGIIYIQITRGSSPRNHEFPKTCQPTIFAMVSETSFKRVLETVEAVTADDSRWMGCHVKTTSLYANTGLRNLATIEGAQETILHRDGYLTEGASSSVFLVSKEGVVYTPSLSSNILPGITRKILLDISSLIDVPIVEEEIEMSRLKAAREIWLANSSLGIRCVSSIDGATVGNGEDYQIAARFHAHLNLEKGIKT